MDLWMKARVFAEEAAKRSQELTKDAARLSQEFVAETAKMSKEMAAEAAKKAEIVRSEALRAADQIKAITVDIPIPIPSALGQGSSASAASDPGLDLERFGVTEELRGFVQGIKISTFRDFPMQDEPEISDACTVGNVRQDLNEWQARHATLVLSTVKEISKFRYELCPRYMKERKFWRIYFILVDNYVARYEKQYMEGRKEETKDENKSAVQASAAETKGTKLTPEDLDVFLLGDLGSDDEDLGGGHDGLDDDFDKIGSTSGLDSDIEKI